MKKAENMLLENIRGKRHIVGIGADGVVLTPTDTQNREEERREERARFEATYFGRNR